MSKRVYRLGRGPRHCKGVGFEVAQISDERWGAVIGDEVAAHVHGCFSLPMGMEREDRCE